MPRDLNSKTNKQKGQNMEPLTLAEIKAIRSAMQGSIDLYRGYVKLNPETPQMKRKQAIYRKRLTLLQSAFKKLK